MYLLPAPHTCTWHFHITPVIWHLKYVPDTCISHLYMTLSHHNLSSDIWSMYLIPAPHTFTWHFRITPVIRHLNYVPGTCTWHFQISPVIWHLEYVPDTCTLNSTWHFHIPTALWYLKYVPDTCTLHRYMTLSHHTCYQTPQVCTWYLYLTPVIRHLNMTTSSQTWIWDLHVYRNFDMLNLLFTYQARAERGILTN